MNFNKVTLTAFATLLLGGTVAYAASNEVKGVISNLKYKVNGYAWSPSANSAKPVIINGQTFIPASVVTQATKINITVDAATKTLQFGEKLNKAPIFKESIKFKNAVGFSNNAAYTKFNGVDYKEVVAAPKIYGDGNLILYPNKKYQTLTIDAFSVGYKAEIHFVDSASKNELKTIMLEPGTGITSSEINIAGVSEIAVKLQSLESNTDKKGADIIILPTSYYK
ncbi:stalk domain-containing protein [Paenibacillus apii]|uniref:stalk domain-containing protein n=1 Tax=Paenibacillus apii TaxID=1850370 RepID=UPI001439F119|nr:stalk domain-containing protein [Paenibacillus apii]NJJ37802.1 hypothetical protein [Paenibacillus apii]